MNASLMRARRAGEHAKVGFVELFFDLVFVFAITQVSHLLLAHLTPLGALEAAILLAAVWWVWIDTSWITNWLDPERGPVRLMLFGLMAAGLVMSTSLPSAFGDKGLAFACAFAAIQVGRSLFTLWAVRGSPVQKANFLRISAWSLLGAIFWIGGGLAEGQTRLLIWLVALLLEFTAPAVGYVVPGLGRSNTAEWDVEGAHLAERVGLFVIICLGESIVVTGATFAGLTWTAPVVVAFASALTTAITMWWLFFNEAHEAAAETFVHASDPGAIARRVYTYCPIIVVAGIVVTAVGDELALAHPLGATTMATTAVLLGGPLLFLLGTSLSILAIWGRIAWPRVAGIGLLAAAAVVAPLLQPLVLTLVSTVVLVLAAIWESVEGREKKA
ncbi:MULTISPECIES: low temperature requirement protein A [unclassified Brevundimonas]|uniref:low temperature requirement protein A n=1 Tax=unclassified Brevundimonas TaxID=2622653 RepID=UPI0025BEB63E|nr:MULTISPECIES: low temperature requirement protein A [unclassified Brevundimonas]